MEQKRNIIFKNKEDVERNILLTDYLESVSGFKIKDLDLDEINDFLQLLEE